MALVQIPILSSIFSIGYDSFAEHSDARWMAFVGVSASLTMMATQYFRSNLFRVLAQLSDQVWKLCAFLIFASVCTFNLPIDAISTTMIAMFSVSALSVAVALSFPIQQVQSEEDFSVRKVYRVGLRFYASSLLLAFSQYLEIVLVNTFSDVHAVATYFSHLTFFVLPISAVGGFLGFLAGPWVRDNRLKFLFQLSEYWLHAVGVSLVCVFLAFNFGYFAWQFFDMGATDLSLVLAFTFGSLARLLYTLPSAFVGNFGSIRQHDAFILGQLLCLGLAAALYLFLTFGFGMEAQYGAAWGAALNLTLRTAFGYLMIHWISRFRGSDAQ
ncbi:hypothetical protein Rsw2DRAFT_0292 [Rhodobacter ferrooxidans]|uniref:Polysaccharide biosynthesis protein n=2 Tax=Rhodobacter ferrooxidans TaxID=371731 RepID=C8RWW4_9RHOB|nr:hypothetical protein Rsw2DRAFT_0292 [Rhodobacter sp. SW2]